ncbi:MAG: T9SS type A sorting domain-containing protein, partial [Candidatus Marinimicrobia bacterium]|nr:T9SS type A sorting domain-containing protein [Candidatus Neomarinimicrobiota bacterium]
GGIEFQYNSVADLYADYGSVLESLGTGCDGCTGNLEEMDAVTSFDIAVQSEFENWANNYEFGEYYFQFIDENDNDTYDGGEIYAVSCEGDESYMTVAYDGSVYDLEFQDFWMDAYDFDWGDDDDGDREDISRNYDALTFAQDYVNDNSSDWGENTFDLESEFSLVVDGDYVSGGLGGDDPENCEINWPEDPYKMAVYSFVSEYVLVEGGSVGCFLDDGDLDQTYADFVMGMENEWAGGGDDDDDDDEDDDGPDLLIMNMDLMEFFMVSFGMDLDSLDIENPTVIGFGSSSDDENMVMGLMFDETGVIELMADSEEAAAATSIDETSITFTNLSLYDSTGAAVLTVTGTIGPGWIDLEAGVETPIDFFNEDGEGDDDMEFYVSFSEDSTGMDIEVGYDDYYGEEYSDTSYFDWSATTDSLFLYFEGDYYYYYYYYEDEADTMALGYMIIEDTLFASASFNPCEDDGYESYEECFSDMDLPGFDELVDVESFRINQETVFTSTVLTSIEPTNGELPEEFKLYAAYPNPFNPVTTIRFDVGSTSHESTLRIYDLSGRNVATLINGQLQPGNYEVQWDARGFASGIYFSELISGTKRHTQKMVLLK